MDHTHLQLCFTLSTRDIPDSYFKPKLAFFSYSHLFSIFKSNIFQRTKTVGKHKSLLSSSSGTSCKRKFSWQICIHEKKKGNEFIQRQLLLQWFSLHDNYVFISWGGVGGDSSSQRMETIAEVKMSTEATSCHCRFFNIVTQTLKSILISRQKNKGK